MLMLNKQMKNFYMIILALIIVAFSLNLYCELNRYNYFYAVLTRNILIVVVFFLWGTSIQKRIIQKNSRKYLTIISALIIFWYVIRTVKYSFLTDVNAMRYAWYLYYVPMLFIPVISFFIGICLGKSEYYSMPKKWNLLLIVSVILFLFVITNDFHQLVFDFPENKIFSDTEYSYSWGYYVVMAYILLCTICTIVLIITKSHSQASKKIFIIPILPIILLIIYFTMYLNGFWIQKLLFSDMTVFSCYVIIAAFEGCIICNLIPANTRYMELFYATTLNLIITDKDYNVKYVSQINCDRSKEDIVKSMEGSGYINKGIRLLSAPIRGGYVLWEENVSEIVDNLHKLKEINESLEDKNIAVKDEYETNNRKLHLIESNRLYNKMQLQTEDKIVELKNLLEELEKEKDTIKGKEILLKMSFMGAYVKRRNNLLFISEEEHKIPENEIYWAIRESLRCLKMKAVVADCSVSLGKAISFEDAVTLYDKFQYILEYCLCQIEDVFVKISLEEDELKLQMSILSKCNLLNLKSEEILVDEDDRDSWWVCYSFRQKGEM